MAGRLGTRGTRVWSLAGRWNSGASPIPDGRPLAEDLRGASPIPDGRPPDSHTGYVLTLVSSESWWQVEADEIPVFLVPLYEGVGDENLLSLQVGVSRLWV